MERGTKLVGGYFGLCFVFMAFVSVSSINFYNPYHYITKIGILLNELHKDLTNMNIGDLKVVGPRFRALEHEKDCAGSFLDIFQQGTKEISNFILNHSVHNITDAINDCVTKLKDDCANLKEHKQKCKDMTHKEKLIRFVEGFGNFSISLQSWKTCGEIFDQEHELDDEYDLDEIVSFCGNV